MVKVMMCKSTKSDKLDNYEGTHIAELKKDGNRILYKNGKFFTIDRKSKGISRDVTYKLPELKHTPVDAVLDGEIVAEDGTFESTGSRIQTEDKLAIRILSKKTPVYYFIFDILQVKGEDVTSLPLTSRKKLLESLKLDNDRFKILEWTEDIQKLWDNVVKNNREGIILKKKNGTYESGKRSYNWLKCKHWKEDIVTISDYEENPKGIRAVMDNDQGLQIAGYHAPPVKNALDKKGEVQVEIQYLSKDKKAGTTKDEYRYRFPSFKRMVEV